MEVFVARQPIFNRSSEVIGYELLYRDSQRNDFNFSTPSDVATAILLMNSYFHFGIEHLVGHLTAFINFDEKLLMTDAPLLLSTQNVVVEILENVKETPIIKEKLTTLRHSGYTLAIDDFVLDYPHKEIIQLAQIIKVDFLHNSREDIQSIFDTYHKQGKLLLAEKVETQEAYQ